MTNVVAIKILKIEKDKLMSELECNRDWELITALDIAIESLKTYTGGNGEEQPTGEWIPVNPIQMDLLGGYKCSLCGSGDYSIQIGVDKYCKFCGTKMKGGETDE